MIAEERKIELVRDIFSGCSTTQTLRIVDVMVATWAKEGDAVGTLDFLSMPAGEEKSRYLQGNYALAAQEVFRWYEERDYFIKEKEAPNRGDVYVDECTELLHEIELHMDQVKSMRDGRLSWHDEPPELTDLIWKIAGESADVAIVMGSKLREMGYSSEWVGKFWSGELEDVQFTGILAQYRDDIHFLKQVMGEIGKDLAESIIEKLTINEQHYPLFAHAWVLNHKIGSEENAHTFARGLRYGVGDPKSSQMKDLAMSPRWGELTLSPAQRNPFGSNGYKPDAITIVDGQVVVADDDYTKTYGLYAVGWVEGLYEPSEYRFHHEPGAADYDTTFLAPEWMRTIAGLKETGTTELVVPSGSGFRLHGLARLSFLHNLHFENVGNVEDELSWNQYLKWCRLQERHPDVFEYQRFVAEGKNARLDVDHDSFNNNSTHEGLVVAMDEIILWWNPEINDYEPMEKPTNEEEAYQQIMRLVSGETFVVSNATSVSALQGSKNKGVGISYQLIPMRVNCKDDEERLELAGHWLELYRRAARKEGSWKVTPSGVSLLHYDLQPYMQMIIPSKLEETVSTMINTSSHKDFIKNLINIGTWQNYLEITDKQREQLGISIGGLSMVGLREAIGVYLITNSWHPDGYASDRRERRLKRIEEMMKL